MPTIPYKNAAGKRIAGVTTIENNLGWNKDPLMYWAWSEGIEGRNFRETGAKAADAGTIGHEMIDCEIKGRSFDSSKYDKPLLDKAETCYVNFLEWKRNFDFEVVDTEIHLISEKYQFGGTPDCIALIKGKAALLDWKTGSGVFPEQKIQLAAYRKLWEENNPLTPLIGGMHLLQISKESASFHHHWWQDLEEAWEAFKLARKLHDLKKVIKKL